MSGLRTLGGGSGITAFPLDATPGVASDWDDEFTSNSIDAKWSNLCAAAVATAQLDGSRALIEPNQSGTSVISTRGAFGYRQNAPSGDFEVLAKLTLKRGFTGGSDARWGLMIADMTTPRAYVLGQQQSQYRAANLINCNTPSITDAWGAFSGTDTNTGAAQYPIWGWYKFVYDGTLAAYYNFTGDDNGWIRMASGMALAQPTYIGIAGFANTAGFYADEGVIVDYFRVREL